MNNQTIELYNSYKDRHFDKVQCYKELAEEKHE